MKLATSIIKVVQSGSVAGIMFMALCPDKLFGKWISFPYPWVVFGFLASAVVSSLVLAFTGQLRRGQVGLMLSFLSVLAGAAMAR